MIKLEYFGGWGPCGALNESGTFEFFFLLVPVYLIPAILATLIMLRIQPVNVLNHATLILLTKFQKIRVVLGLIGRLLTILGLMYFAYQYIINRANFGGLYDGEESCDPITPSMIAIVILLLALTIYSTKRRLFTASRK